MVAGHLAKQTRLAHINVLVADADSRISHLVRRVLASLGFGTVHLAKNGQDALRILREKPVDIVITEWDMEPLGGIEFINRVRSGHANVSRMLPIVMLTGKTQRKYVEKARDAGMTEFVVKPFTVRTLCDRIILVVEHPRNFILSPRYCGPDRRRRAEPVADTGERRAGMGDDARVIARNTHSVVLRVKGEDVTIVDPDFAIRQKIGEDVSVVDLFSPESVRTAQRLIHASRGEFLEWVMQDITRLEAAYHRLEANPGHSSDEVKVLYHAGMQVKSRAGIFGFDLASRVAESLTKITDNRPHADAALRTVVRKHLDALYVIFQRNIQGTGGKLGHDLMDSLHLLTQKYQD